jgi:hypothetical protein
MLGITGGELFLLCFIVGAVVSWPWWPRLGEAIAGLLAGAEAAPAPERDESAPPGD